MAKNTFRCKTFASKTFASGTFAGVGSSFPPINPPFVIAGYQMFIAGSKASQLNLPGGPKSTYIPGAVATQIVKE